MDKEYWISFINKMDYNVPRKKIRTNYFNPFVGFKYQVRKIVKRFQ